MSTHTSAKFALKDAIREKMTKKIQKRQEELNELTALQEESMNSLSTLKSTLETMTEESQHIALTNKAQELISDIQKLVEEATIKLETIERDIASIPE